MNNTTQRVAMIVFGLAIGLYGVNHFRFPVFIGQLVPKWMPGGGELWAYITGACLVLAAIAIIAGKYRKWAGWLLALFLLMIILTIDLPKVISTGFGYNSLGDMSDLLKVMAMLAGALFIAAKSS